MSITEGTAFIVELIDSLQEAGFDRARLEMLRSNPNATRSALQALDSEAVVPNATWTTSDIEELIRYANRMRSNDEAYVTQTAQKYSTEELFASTDRLTQYLLWNRVKSHDQRKSRVEIGTDLGLSHTQVERLVKKGFSAVTAELHRLESERMRADGVTNRAEQTSLHSLGLKTRTLSALSRNMYSWTPPINVAELLQRSTNDIQAVPNFGETAFKDLKHRLEEHGFDPPWGDWEW